LRRGIGGIALVPDVEPFGDASLAVRDLGFLSAGAGFGVGNGLRLAVILNQPAGPQLGEDIVTAASGETAHREPPRVVAQREGQTATRPRSVHRTDAPPPGAGSARTAERAGNLLGRSHFARPIFGSSAMSRSIDSAVIRVLLSSFRASSRSAAINL
jgi:hypothetical protein